MVLSQSFDHLGALAAGSAYDRAVDLQLPDGLTGSYYVFVSTGGPFEFVHTDDNRTLAGQTQISLAPSPDLVVTNIAAPVNSLEGNPIEISWTVLNQGDAIAAGSWTDSLVLRKLGDPTAATVALGNFSYTAGLGVGLSYIRTERFTVPRLEGVWKVEVTTNATSSLYENGVAANNNYSADDQTMTLSVKPRPDLQVEAITAPSVAAAGTTINVSFDVVNRGSVATATAHWKDNVYLSLDGTLDGGDLLIGSLDNGSALAPDARYRSTSDALLIPLRFRGDGYIIVRADAGQVVDEYPFDSNNTLVQKISVTPFPPSDLVTGGVVAPTQAVYGSDIEVRFTVRNLGSNQTNAGSWNDTVWLTRDLTRPNPGGNGGILLGTFAHTGALAVGESYEQIVTVHIPDQIASGVYYITPWADAYDVVLEDTLASNINPDDPHEIDNNNYKARRIDIIGTPVVLPDLQVINVTADAVGSTNAAFNVSWTVENHGEGDASGLTWGDSVYLSDVADIHAPGAKVWLLGDFERPVGLAPFERYTMNQAFNLSPALQGDRKSTRLNSSH